MAKGYGQFCPIAVAAEVLCERWVPLVLRELMYGSRRFNDLARGVPLMSRGLLATRLRQLERAGIVRHAGAAPGKGGEYRLTPAGEALRPVVEQMGLWARHWSTRGLLDQDLDDALLVWGLRRSLRVPPGIGRRVVLRFDFYGLPRGARVARRSWWLVAQASEVEICLKDPGFETDVLVIADLRAFTEVLLGDRSLRAAQREGCIRLAGDRAILRALPQWLPLSGEALTSLGIAPGVPVPGKVRAAA
ncbi:MAG TPA: helix-turn-helix domain-containing protein [Burkholderiales bacterium]|nr:helix-turn-helix domain-containing protein [Burkholderiales bacterium]